MHAENSNVGFAFIPLSVSRTNPPVARETDPNWISVSAMGDSFQQTNTACTYTESRHCSPLGTLGPTPAVTSFTGCCLAPLLLLQGSQWFTPALDHRQVMNLPTDPLLSKPLLLIGTGWEIPSLCSAAVTGNASLWQKSYTNLCRTRSIHYTDKYSSE